MTPDEPKHLLKPPGAGGSFSELSPRDRDAIGVTFNRYALGTDMADSEMLLTVFVPKAVLVGSIGTAPPFLEVKGSAEIAAYVVETRRKHGYGERHFITNLTAWLLSPHTARAQAYFLVTRMDGKAVVNSATGNYQADLVCGEDLAWRIERIDVRMDTSLQ